MNRLYPVFLNLEGRRCVVVGGGKVAWRKALSLVECGARVTVVAPELDERLEEMAESGQVERVARGFERGDLEGADLVIAATDDEETNRAVADEAGRLGVACNVVDRPELCGFQVPSVMTRGDLKIAVSTNGKFPGLAAGIRKMLEEDMGEEFAETIARFGRLREEAKRRWPDDAERRMRVMKEVGGSAELMDALRRRDREKLEAIWETWTSCLSD